MQAGKLKVDQIPFVTGIYQQELPQSFIGRLGGKFLSLYFRTTIKSPHAFTLIVKKENVIIGFATCCLDQTKLFLNIFRQAPLSVGGSILVQTLKNPSLIKEYFALLKYYRNKKESVKPQLLSFAVARSFQRQGIGQILLQAVKKEFRKLDILEFKVGVWNELEGAKRFYQKTEGKFLEEIQLPGRKIIYYSYETR